MSLLATVSLNHGRRGPDSDRVVARLEQLFAVILAHARKSPKFARELEKALAGGSAAAAAEVEEVEERSPAVLDPFTIYEAGWEAMLRQRLGRLDSEQLKDVIHQFRLERRGQKVDGKSADELCEWIVKAVLDRQRTP